MASSFKIQGTFALVIWANFGLPPAISSILYSQKSRRFKTKESSNYKVGIWSFIL